MKGEGAIVFLVVFAILLVATLAIPDIPPGKAIYDALGVEESDEPVLGIGVTDLAVAVFNGVIYGFVAWLIFTIFRKTKKEEKKEQK